MILHHSAEAGFSLQAAELAQSSMSLAACCRLFKPFFCFTTVEGVIVVRGNEYNASKWF